MAARDHCRAADPPAGIPLTGTRLGFFLVAQEIGDQSGERSLRRQAELGRLLAAAEGYRVVASDGAYLGWLDHVRYERYADHPDEIVVRRGAVLARRRRALPFSVVEMVRARERTVVLRLNHDELERRPPA